MSRARELSKLGNINVLSADDVSSEVGIASTVPRSTLDVRGELQVGTVIQAGTAGVLTATSFDGGLSGNIVAAACTFTTGNFTGNVTIGGTLTYEDVTNVDALGIVTARAGVNVSGGQFLVGSGVTIGNAGVATFSGTSDVHLHDNVRLNIGDASDLAIYHNGSNSFIQDTGTGSLFIDGTIVYLRNTAGDEHLANFHSDGAANLYYNGSLTFSTTDDGTTTTGICSATDFSGLSGGAADFPNGLTGTTGTFSSDLDIAGDLRHIGDANTKIRFPSADTITAETGGSERLRIDSSGNVSIGNVTAAPTGSAYNAGTLHIHQATSGASYGSQIKMTTTQSGSAAGDGAYLAYYGNNELYIYNKENAAISFGTNATERLRVASNGRIGIATEVPEALVDIEGGEVYYHSGTGNAFGVKLTYSNSNSTGIIDSYGNHDLELRTNNVARFALDTSGNLQTKTTTQNGHVGLITSSNAINLTLGSTRGTAPRIYLYGTGNGQSEAGNIFMGAGTGGLLQLRSAEDIRFEVNSDSTTAEALRITSAGLVGIGQDVPLAKLHINGSSASAPCLVMPDPTNERYSVGFGNINVGGVGQRLDFYAGDSGGNTTNLGSNARRMSMTAQGRLGIGHTNPQDILTLSTSDDVTSLRIVDPTNNDYGAHFSFYDSASEVRLGGINNTTKRASIRIHRDSPDTSLFVSNAGKIGINSSVPQGYLTIATDSASSQIELKRLNTNTTGALGALNFTAMDGHSCANIHALGDGNDEGAHLIFKTTSAAAENNPYGTGTVERLRISSTGQIGIAGANYGTSGQVLTSGGSGGAPSWADAGGGATEVIQSWDFGANYGQSYFETSATGITTSSGFIAYELIISGLQFVGGESEKLSMRVYKSGGSLESGDSYKYYCKKSQFTSTSDENETSNNVDKWTFMGNNNNDREFWDGSIKWKNPGYTTGKTMPPFMRAEWYQQYRFAHFDVCQVSGFANTDYISGFRIYNSSDSSVNLMSGRACLIGYKFA